MAIRSSLRRLVAVSAFALAVGSGFGGPSVLQPFVGSAGAATVVIQRTTIYISTLPKGCVKTEYNGGKVVVWKCGSLFYQPYNGRYVRVYVRYE